MENFGERLREARRKKGVTQEWMAKQLHIHRSTYTKYESGSVEPSLGSFLQLVKLLDLDPMDLLE